MDDFDDDDAAMIPSGGDRGAPPDARLVSPARIPEGGNENGGVRPPLLALASHGRGKDGGVFAAVKERDSSSHGAAKRRNAADLISPALLATRPLLARICGLLNWSYREKKVSVSLLSS